MTSLSKHCNPLFKKHHNSDVNCHKSKRPSWFSGDKLSLFLEKDVMNHGQQYRVCDNVNRSIKGVRVRRRETDICSYVNTKDMSRDKRMIL